MSILHLRLHQSEGPLETLDLPAQSVIETTLTVTPDRVSLPTLISAENIIGQINRFGFELCSPAEIDKITDLINNFYLPTPIASWSDRALDLEVTQISPRDRIYYEEIQDIRQSVTQAARDAAYFESQDDYSRSKQAQDAALKRIARSVESKPGWWNKEKILGFVAKTMLGVLIDALVGIPLSVFVKSILDGVFSSS